jgi:predicted GNAT family acetyltransferase
MADQPRTVQISDNKALQRYEARGDGVLAGYATYERTHGGIVLLHTKTEPAFEGHGVASLLAEAALDDARGRRLHVTPKCPFMAAFIDRHPEYGDLVAQAT